MLNLELDLVLGELSSLCHPTRERGGKVNKPKLEGKQLELALQVYKLGLKLLKG